MTDTQTPSQGSTTAATTPTTDAPVASTTTTVTPTPEAPKEVEIDSRGFAVTTGYVTIYNYDTSGFLIDKELYWITEGTGVPARSTRTAPPTVTEGHVAVYDTTKGTWKIFEDHRGETVYDKTTGQKGQITQVGALPDSVSTVAPPSDYCTWDDTTHAWVVDKVAAQAALKKEAQVQMAKLMAAINRNGYGPFNQMPSDLEAYGDALGKIISGKDTTSIALPTAPASLNN